MKASNLYSPRGSLSPSGPPPPAVLPLGHVPLVMATEPGDLVVDPGRVNAARVAEHVVFDIMSTAIAFGPGAPITVSGVFTGAALPLAVSTGVVATVLVTPGIILSVGSNAGVALGDTQLSISGSLASAGGAAGSVSWVQNIIVSQRNAGTSRFIIMANQLVAGQAYPQLAYVGPSASLPLTVTINSAPINTNFQLTQLTPSSEYWTWALSYWRLSARS